MTFAENNDKASPRTSVQRTGRSRNCRQCDVCCGQPWYKVQVCASRSHDEALRLACELRSLGYTAYVVADLDYKAILGQDEGES